MTAQPNVMADVKDWLLNKCRDAGSLLAVDRLAVHGGKNLAYSNMVVTPENIPKFTIPPSVDGSISPTGNGSPETDGHSHCSSGSMLSLRSTSPRPCSYLNQQSSTQRLLPSPTTRSRSAPVSPMRSLAERTPCTGGLVMCGDDLDEEGVGSAPGGHTNCDPMSIAALSLPHLKMRTQFGFETLSESPHTRRKESLFHTDGADSRGGGPAGRPLCLGRVKRKTPGWTESPQIITEDTNQGLAVPGGRRGKRRHNVPAVIAPLGVVLSPDARSASVSVSRAEAFPYNQSNLVPFSSCPEFSRSTGNTAMSQAMSPVSPRGNTTSCSAGNSPCLRYRRSSLREDATPETSSTKASPDIRWRRKSSANLMMVTSPELPHSLHADSPPSLIKAPSSSTVSSDTSTSPCSSCRSCSRVPDPSLGEVRLSLQYIPKLRQLHVGLLRAENLPGGELLNTYVKLYLMPGKNQRQLSKVVRHSADPIFNQQFLFNSIEQRHVRQTRLRLKLYNKVTKLGRDELLSEVQINLGELQPSQEVRILRPLEPPIRRHELGYIHMSVCFHASAEKLTVTVHQVTDLTRHTFTGAPDPYVRVQLCQPRRSEPQQQTKAKKKNTAPVYNESFTFSISPKIEDLHQTSLTLTVLDRSTLRTDVSIGQVRLGYGATEEAEFHHWNQVLQQPGRVATNWHMLMDPVDN